MSDNILAYDALSATQYIRTTDNAGVHTPHNISVSADTMASVGLIPEIQTVHIYGRNPDVDTGTVPEDLWEAGGAYAGFPITGSAETLSVVSASTDDAAAGTGARTLKIVGLDSNYEPIEETVTLNGTTPVTTVATFWRVHYAEVQTVGSGGSNAGLLTCTHSTTTANKFFDMTVGRNRTAMGIYTVPAGFTALMRFMSVWNRGNAAAVWANGDLWLREDTKPAILRRPWVSTNAVPFQTEMVGGLAFPEKTDIAIRVSEVSTSNLDIVGSFSLILVATP